MKRAIANTMFLVAAICFAAAGCRSADRLTYDNFSRIEKNASSQEDVVGAIGEPTHRLSDLWIYERPSEHLVVKVEFNEGGQVQRKEWVDGRTGQWDDTND